MRHPPPPASGKDQEAAIKGSSLIDAHPHPPVCLSARICSRFVPSVRFRFLDSIVGRTFLSTLLTRSRPPKTAVRFRIEGSSLLA